MVRLKRIHRAFVIHCLSVSSTMTNPLQSMHVAQKPTASQHSKTASTLLVSWVEEPVLVIRKRQVSIAFDPKKK